MTTEAQRDERKEIYATYRAMYSHYVKHLLLSGIAIAAVAGLYLKASSADWWDASSPLALTLAILAPVICVSWGAGWAYLNVELWAYRHYLAYLDEVLPPQDPVGRTLHGDVFRKAVYAARPRAWLLRHLGYTDTLNLMVGLFPAFVGFGVLYMAVKLMWEAGGTGMRITAVLYGVVLFFLYLYVFFVKAGITRAVHTALWDAADDSTQTGKTTALAAEGAPRPAADGGTD